MNTIKEGLEGLVLKDVKSIYEPGKRHWLKMKKDYLDSGSMADTADLVCLGAYYGTGNKGGLMSVFLMGVYNEKKDCWQTVTKVGNGFDDKTLDMFFIHNKEPLTFEELFRRIMHNPYDTVQEKELSSRDKIKKIFNFFRSAYVQRGGGQTLHDFKAMIKKKIAEITPKISQ
jgi:ATP-dependent DNA ligase